MKELPERCVPCEGGESPLPMDEVREYLLAIPAWSLENARLHRRFTLKNFRKALAWINRVGMLAEEQGHHPDFHLTSWNKVELELWTHAAGGLTVNDFVLARKIDDLARADELA